MTLLIVGLLLWWGSHLLPIFAAPRRDVLVARLGDGAYKGAYSLVTVLAIVAMVIGYQQASFIVVWSPPGFLTHLNNLLMLVAVAFFIAGFIPSVVRRKIRHPQLIGLKTWALAHLLVNGDLASIILFGGLMAWAVLAMIGTNRRDGARGPLPEQTKMGLPVHVVATLVVFGLFTFVHGGLLGVSPFPG